MVKFTTRTVIEVQDWDDCVTQTYGKPYSLQQQDGCKDRGSEYISVPSEETYDEDMHDSIPDEINGKKMGVKFDVWLARDPNAGPQQGYEIGLFWERNFYPDLATLANDMHKRGLLPAGDFTIDIDW